MAVANPRPALLVTGGAGYIGSHVCKAVAEAGFLPVAYDNLSAGHHWAVRWGPLECGDLVDAGRLDEVMRQYRPTAVIHLAGLIISSESVVDPGQYYTNNVAGTFCLLDAMRRNAVDRIVFSSSAAVYGEPETMPMGESHPQRPLNPYGTSKQMVERVLQDYARAYGLHSVSLRYFNAAGADPEGEIGEAHHIETHLIPLVLDVAAGYRSHVAIYGADYPTRDGTCVRDYVHVCDLAAAHVAALRYLDKSVGAHVFNLGSGNGATVREVIDLARRITGEIIPVRVETRRPGDPAVLLADPTRARQLLGWNPLHSGLDAMISTAWSWHQRVLSRAQAAQ
ncbi:MAG TPA: UDP-glucose 4-epimerase GalE [Ferrovibrio sp.]|uniref:UDP-glucose 4-epimerase GalE n=1 Tax=Ferrovibrio sp. TaxID=1917215 RepID=UPI002ED1423E